MKINLHNIADLTDREAAALRFLSDVVYPPETSTSWPGQSIEWSAPQWCVVCWDDDGQALSHVGALLRDGIVDDSRVKIGGIGGVKTHPNARRQGLATKAIRRAIDFFAEQDADFALLVCAPDLVSMYERLGWLLYPDALLVTQQGKRTRFTFNLPMIHEARAIGPSTGVIDLLGPPW